MHESSCIVLLHEICSTIVPITEVFLVSRSTFILVSRHKLPFKIFLIRECQCYVFCRFPEVSTADDSDIDEIEPQLPPIETFIRKEILRKLKPKEKKWQDLVNGRLYYCTYYYASRDVIAINAIFS